MKFLDEMEIPFEVNALSAHRTPKAVEEFAANAAARGVKVVIAGAGMAAALKTVARHLQANGQTLLFETGQETPVAMLRMFEAIGTDNLGVNLDTANLILYGKANPVDALDVFGRYVLGVHAKDGFYPENGHDLGREVPLGRGKVDFPALLRRLRELGYDGCLTIEREIAGEEQARDIREAKLYLEAILASL